MSELTVGSTGIITYYLPEMKVCRIIDKGYGAYKIQIRDETPISYFMDSVKRFEEFAEDIPALELDMIKLSIRHKEFFDEL